MLDPRVFHFGEGDFPRSVDTTIGKNGWKQRAIPKLQFDKWQFMKHEFHKMFIKSIQKMSFST